jgi:uncharacterized membrane protein
MAAFFSSLRNTVIAGFVLAAVLVALALYLQGYDQTRFWMFFVRWGHVISGVMWIGLLWYFNFVSTPTMPKIPAELKPALGRYITPAALFWFRWAAMSTIIFGIILAWQSNYLTQAYTLDFSDGLAGYPLVPKALVIGIGMWLGTIMWFNVWVMIWPNQKKALNIGDKYPNLPQAEKDAAAKTAGMFSRINTMLSIPMLFAMVATSHLYGAI